MDSQQNVWAVRYLVCSALESHADNYDSSPGVGDNFDPHRILTEGVEILLYYLISVMLFSLPFFL